MQLWLIPMIYIGAAVLTGLALPRIEQAYFAYTVSLSVASAQAYLSAAASGMMALTGIVFAMAFVMVQFSAIAYSPRLVLWFARDRVLFHSLGAFSATFIYALFTLAWVDRGGAGTVPLFSSALVVAMIIISMLLFSRLMQRLSDLQISNVLQLIGDNGRAAIHEMFRRLDDKSAATGELGTTVADHARFGRATQILKYSGRPRTIAKLDVDALVRQAERAGGAIIMACAVGDTLVENTILMRIHDAEKQIPEHELLRAVHLQRERTFEQDPKYPIRLLVDVAIKALSPAINDPTTAVQTIDQIEDLLHRLGARRLDAGYVKDANGVPRLVIPMPTWEDYLTLAFDEIRQYGAASVQVMRRLRAALVGLVQSLPSDERASAVRRYLEHLDLAIDNSPLDPDDRLMARQEDRQGIGLSRRRAETN
jgi:uncharacterized membrane protein